MHRAEVGLGPVVGKPDGTAWGMSAVDKCNTRNSFFVLLCKVIAQQTIYYGETAPPHRGPSRRRKEIGWRPFVGDSVSELVAHTQCNIITNGRVG